MHQEESMSLPDAESLYYQLLECFYTDEDRVASKAVAVQLKSLLEAQPEVAESIRGDEINLLIAEIDGNLKEAIRYRESEIRRILELQLATKDTPQWDYVRRRYDFSDVGDRLDLLAILFDEDGDTERAISTLNESKRFCESHGIAFDGQDILDELQANAH